MPPTSSPGHAELFHRLHAPGKPLVLVNAWDAVSARVVEEAGSPAIATTSAGIAWSLGYADGEQLPREALVAACARIFRVVRVPVTADIERGYGRNAEEVSGFVGELVELGVVGVNIEDGVSRETGRLHPAEELCRRIAALRTLAGKTGVRLFINARTDAYFAPEAEPQGRFAEALQRARLFASAGADGIFVPGMGQLEEIARFTQEIALPLNIYAGYPGVPSVEALAAAGVRRVSLGCGPLQSALDLLRRIATGILKEGRSDAMTSGMMPVKEVNRLFSPA